MAAQALVEAGLARAHAGARRLGGARPRELGAARAPSCSPRSTPPTSPYRGARPAGGATVSGSCTCVGGPSVFYGGATLPLPRARLRGRAGDRRRLGRGVAVRLRRAGAVLHAGRALLGVAGETGRDPTEPPRSAPFPQPPAAARAASSRMIADAARALGLHPFRLPLAINHAARGRAPPCVACTTCDTFACAIEAKNDLATR